MGKNMFNIKDKLYIATFQQDAAAVAAEYGLGLEINHTCISEDLDPDKRRRLIDSISRDLHVSGGHLVPLVHGPFTEIYPAAIDRRARDMAAERLEEAYGVCRAIGSQKMIVHTGWLPFIYFKEWQAEKGARFWHGFMAHKPEDFGLLVENVLEDEPYMLLDFMMRVAEISAGSDGFIPDGSVSKRIRLCLDIGHAHAMTGPDMPVEKWIEILGGLIGHFHLHNNDGTADTHSAFDRGSMDMESVFSAIREHCSPDVTFTIEAGDCRACAEWLSSHGYI